MPEFDFDIKKKDWRPKCIDDIVNEVARSFCTKLTVDDLFILGTDYVQNKRIETDSDLQNWLKTESKTYEKLIKVKVPDRLLPKGWQPKKQMILTKSKKNVIARFFGDEEVSTRQVHFTLKFLDCSHFRLKQALLGSGPSPYWVIFEGKWARTSRGFKLEFCLRYPFQKAKKQEFDLCFEAMPDTHMTSLAFTDETEKQLAGQLPAIVGTEAFAWIELVQEHDTESNPKARFNLEEEQSESLEPRQPKEVPEPPIQRHPEPSNQKQPTEEEEPIWLTYVGLGVFLALVLVFSWMQWGTSSSEEF
mmetsp:Transcript_34180/g.79451  ORF Transcript_34180/g.79451 Transcript_34180/m.79451 type:complete len:304 (+) Transcript_34180:148-1059(+)|eukprot:CAMPEP_0171093062 /NCGR_PEP_ID=MMETSP0766_2-20121228/38861_1 /TAXON_ID=439317 /ORGANISM="Gambierdiscus australes, Strain CAWD 149" /LENGTH=303 /DNA_ID=CAMNT_0011551445 /DNA_START=144 /DNA_END=1055 /DNA_ORIENTATION=+